MEDTDFDLLCKSLSADEAKRMRKILNEWCDGDENGFPVQLVLLVRAQWRAAALLPRAIGDSGKLIEKNLAECRQHTAAIVKNLSTVTENSTTELKSIVQMHTETVNQASVALRNQLWETEDVAKRIRNQLDGALPEWRKAKNDFSTERQMLEKERKDLAKRVQIRDGIYWGFIAFGLLAFGGLLEYWWTH